MVFRWRADDGKLLSGILYPPSLLQLKKKKKKNVVGVGPPLTKLSRSAHVDFIDTLPRNEVLLPCLPSRQCRGMLYAKFLFSLVLYIPVNSYDHVGAVSSSNHTLFPGKA